MTNKRSSLMQYGVKALPVCALLLLASCSSDDSSEASKSSSTALKVTAGIEAQTRAVNAAWESGDQIGIFMLNSGAIEQYDNTPYSTTDLSSFSPVSETIYLPVDGTTRDFVAYYPYSSATASGVCAIDVSDQTTQSAIDLLVSDTETGIDKADPSVALTFSHKLAKLSLSIAAGEGLTASDLAGLEITLSNQYTAGTYDVINGTDAVATGSTSSVTLLTAADGQSSEAIVLPASSTKDMVMTFSVPQIGDFTWNMSESTTTSSFVKGCKYVYSVTINKTALEVTATITDWADGNTGEDITAK